MLNIKNKQMVECLTVWFHSYVGPNELMSKIETYSEIESRLTAVMEGAAWGCGGGIE